MSAHWDQVERLYAESARMDAPERAQLLAQYPAELRDEVLALLAQDAPADFTETMSLPTAAQMGPGRQLGPYLLDASLGAGGMGEVFRAMDTRLRRRVAVKVLPSNCAGDEKHRRRLLQEARAASALNHANIVTVYDISREQDVDFLVMEYITGKTLKDLISDGPLDVSRVAALGAQIAGALNAAHAAGITHRDIKPANLMVTEAQQVKVLDFGIARQTASDLGALTELTVPGTVMGTIAYMSPEQARGEAVDGASDIFSLGCVLYQASTGVLPFRGANSLAVMQAITNMNPPPPSTLQGELPGTWDEVVARCLSKHPDQRPTAAELMAELSRIANPPRRMERLETDQPSVAVLPFRFRTATPEDQFLSVALADAVIHRLNSTGKLLVRPTATVMRYAGKETEWTQVARELNTDLVIEGTIQKMGPKIRVMLQTFRASDSRTLHSVKQEGEMEDLFGLQDRVSDAVAEMFAPRETTAQEPGTPPTKNAMAYELYLRGVERSAFYNRADLQSGIDSFLRATALDPNFAEAWARLAQACSSGMFHFDGDPKWLEMAEAAISRTLELNPIHADALCARSQILFSPHREYQNLPALRAIHAALRINPRCPSALQWRGILYYHYGFYEQGQRSIRDLLQLNPHSPMAWQVSALMSLEVGDYELARDGWDRALLYDPKMLHANIFSPLLPLALDQREQARGRIQRARELFPDEPQVAALEALLRAYEGDVPAAERLAEEAASSTKSLLHSHHAWHCAASAFAVCGKPDKAIAQLHRCAELGMPNYRLFSTDPHLKSLHGNPDFQAFLTGLRRQNDELRAEVELTQ